MSRRDDGQVDVVVALELRGGDDDLGGLRVAGGREKGRGGVKRGLNIVWTLSSFPPSLPPSVAAYLVFATGWSMRMMERTTLYVYRMYTVRKLSHPSLPPSLPSCFVSYRPVTLVLLLGK